MLIQIRRATKRVISKKVIRVLKEITPLPNYFSTPPQKIPGKHPEQLRQIMRVDFVKVALEVDCPPFWSSGPLDMDQADFLEGHQM